MDVPFADQQNLFFCSWRQHCSKVENVVKLNLVLILFFINSMTSVNARCAIAFGRMPFKRAFCVIAKNIHTHARFSFLSILIAIICFTIANVVSLRGCLIGKKVKQRFIIKLWAVIICWYNLQTGKNIVWDDCLCQWYLFVMGEKPKQFSLCTFALDSFYFYTW